MQIKSFTLEKITIPLSKPFVTAIRTATAVESLRITLHTDTAHTAQGEAPASALITGETLPSIEEAICTYIAPAILGKPVESDLGAVIAASIRNNTSAKAAVEMAWQDLRAQSLSVPLYRLLGGTETPRELPNDITISAGSTDSMTESALSAISDGFAILKIKLGTNPKTDARQLIDLYNNIKSHKILLRVDANQGWSAGEAIGIIRAWEALPIDIIEQPTPSWDIEGLAKVKASTDLPIAADESVFSPHDALRVIQSRAADVINIKLMKCGGLGPALEICKLCEEHGLECMVGCMLEGEVSINAARQLAAAQSVITRIDLDAPFLYKVQP